MPIADLPKLGCCGVLGYKLSRILAQISLTNAPTAAQALTLVNTVLSCLDSQTMPTPVVMLADNTHRYLLSYTNAADFDCGDLDGTFSDEYSNPSSNARMIGNAGATTFYLERIKITTGTSLQGAIWDADVILPDDCIGDVCSVTTASSFDFRFPNLSTTSDLGTKNRWLRCDEVDWDSSFTTPSLPACCSFDP